MGTLRTIGAEAAHAVVWPLTALRRGVWQGLSTLEIFLGGFGLIAALVAAALLSPALGELPGAAGEFAPIGMAVLLAPVGVGVALSRRAEVERFLTALRDRSGAVADPRPPAPVAAPEPPPPPPPPPPPRIVIDTSAIIDGRLADVAESGFLFGDLIIPRCVLDELRRVADSSDPLKRRRGRFGLEQLARIQGYASLRTVIDEEPFPDLPDVDAKVLALARARQAALLTNDFNLNRVANVEELRVLNLNALAKAVRINALPGEILELRLHEEGRERDQAVGYLEDGTMVVVAEAHLQIGHDVAVEVTRVIQTNAGRMLFARLRQPPPSGTPPSGTSPSGTAAAPSGVQR